MTEPLNPAERAALAARGWYDTQQRRGERLDPASTLLYQQLGSIYACTDRATGELAPTHADEREHLRVQLEEIGQDVMQEWMRIVDLEDVAGIQFEARVRWQDNDGECIVGESPYGDEYGRFRLTVRAEDLGPVPPIGPENDPAQQHEQPEPMWVLRTWADVRKGDAVRMPGTEMTAAITDRLWHPSEDPRGESWHVVHDGSTEKWAHTRDRVVQPGECVIVSPDIPAAEHGRWMQPTAGVEILLAGGQQELDSIEALGGFSARLRTTNTAPNPGDVR